MNYSEKLKDPRWQDKRVAVLKDHGHQCLLCDAKKTTLNVHHKYYLPDTEPWEYPDDCFAVLCDECHKCEHEALDALKDHLLNCFRRKFMADEITEICNGVLNIKNDHIAGMTTPMLSWFLSNREAMDIGLRMYFMTSVVNKND